ncbi:MAG TPA: hypothetical protein VFV33_26455, partial [Gemmatimonadaceae bacterium]|nr:hypothetical protein [Gemmatimonadaceae bacterium]
QFGPFGALPQHGFARTVRWAVHDDTRRDVGGVTLRLTHHDVAAQRPASEVTAWPHAFTLDAIVQVTGDTLAVRLEASNTGGADFTFTAALHPYLAVADAQATSVEGLTGLTYRDALLGGAMRREEGRTLPITGALDRLYYDAPDTLVIREPHRGLRVEKAGFPDAVVWNPGPSITASKRDFEPGDEERMVCVEAAVVGRPIVLAPGEQWVGVQRMAAI